MDVVRAIVTVLVIPNSVAMISLAGAIMEDETGLLNVNEDTMTVATHFRWIVQLSRMSAGKISNRWLTLTFWDSLDRQGRPNQRQACLYWTGCQLRCLFPRTASFRPLSSYRQWYSSTRLVHLLTSQRTSIAIGSGQHCRGACACYCGQERLARCRSA